MADPTEVDLIETEWLWIIWAVVSIGLLATAAPGHRGFWFGAAVAEGALSVFRALIACIRLGRSES